MNSPDRDPARVASLMERILYEVKRVVVGQDQFLERVLVAMLAQGHLLVEGVPGLAKTLTVKTLAAAVRGQFRRIQFTPDLVPADLVGTRIYNQADCARLTRILRAKALGTSLAEIKHYLDMYGQHGEGRIQQLTYVVEKTDAAIAELEAKRAQIDASLAELRLINERSRESLAAKRTTGKAA